MNEENDFRNVNSIFNELLSDAKNKCEALSKDVLERTKKVLFSSGSAYVFFPYENEVYGLKPGFFIEDESKKNEVNKKNYVGASGEVFMVEDLNNNGSVTSKTIFNFFKEYKERVIFYKAGSFRLKSYARAELDNGEVKRIFNKGVLGESLWDFTYQKGKLEKIKIRERGNEGDRFSERVLLFFYNEENYLKKIVERYENGEDVQIYNT
ncbi:hypothetical protein J2X14_001757 [Pantoea alhagi]|uniref:hypothetical protein n=1 Tax=Mixta sp. BE291 TaxID=3158787 RepID=UPI002854B978|nr:hypothetical protein [Pantoea alhagi]